MSIRCFLGRLYTRETRRYHLPGKQAVSQNGSVYSAAQILRDRRRRRPLVILEAEAHGELLFRGLRENDMTWSLFVLPSPRASVEYADTAARMYRIDKCDCIVALGSGAVMNTAKAAAASAPRPGILFGKRAFRRLRAPFVPMLFAIPMQADGETSAGEATVYREDGTCCTVVGKKLVPAVELLEPGFLENTSREELADAGFAGLSRAVEAYIAPGTGDEECLSLAACAVKEYLENLEPCWNDGGTTQQRVGLMEAARKAGLASSGLGYGYIRGFGEGLCRAGLNGGEAYAVILPLVLEKYGNSITDKLSRLASLTGVMESGGRPERAAAMICRIRDMAFRMGLPETVSGVGWADKDAIAWCTATDIHSLPPVYWTEKQCLNILELAENPNNF